VVRQLIRDYLDRHGVAYPTRSKVVARKPAARR